MEMLLSVMQQVARKRDVEHMQQLQLEQPDRAEDLQGLIDLQNYLIELGGM